MSYVADLFIPLHEVCLCINSTINWKKSWNNQLYPHMRKEKALLLTQNPLLCLIIHYDKLCNVPYMHQI